MDDESGRDSSSRLLRRLHKSYRPGRTAYDKEDLFTEYLAWLLNRSHQFRMGFAELALDESADMSPELFRDSEALTQVDAGGLGWIDLVLELRDKSEDETGDESPVVAARLGIECKVDSALGVEQLERYHRWLENEEEQCEHVGLATLTRKRLGQGDPFEGKAPRHWQGRLYWYQVEEALEHCIREVRSDQLPAIDPEDDDFLAPAGFVVIGDEFRDLMTEEGMLAATMIDSRKVAELFREYERYKDRRVDEILSLVENALDTAGIEALLLENSNTDELRKEQKKNRAKGRPVSLIYHRKEPPACFMFGVLVSPPNKYARQRSEAFDSDSYEAELLAGYKLLDESGGALQVHDDLEEISEAVNATARDILESELEVFVPVNTSYQKWVARSPVPSAEDADEQVRNMARFYRDFVRGFLESEGPDGRPLLTYLEDRHREAVREG